MRTLLAAIVAAALAMPLSARAAEGSSTTGLAWQWDGQARRYLIKADVKLGEYLFFKKLNNSDLRVAEFLVAVITQCAPSSSAGKSAWELTCEIEDLALLGMPTKSDAGSLLAILDEWDATLVGKQVQLVFGADGRVKNVDLDGLDQGNRRVNEMQETMRLVLSRAFAAFDLQLPKKGDDKGRGGWTQTGTLALAFPSERGTFGTSQLEHVIAKHDGDVVEITSKGRGLLGPAEMIAMAGGNERPKNQYDMALQGFARFDRAKGFLVEREYYAEGMPTPSSFVSEGGQGVPYTQAVRLVYLPEGGEIPPLGPNAELESTRD